MAKIAKLCEISEERSSNSVRFYVIMLVSQYVSYKSSLIVTKGLLFDWFVIPNDKSH